MSKIQQCRYACDRPGCDVESPPESSFTAARKDAESHGWGWLIRPSESKPEHVCPACVESLLNGGSVVEVSK